MLERAALATPGVSQLRGPSSDVVGKAEAGGLFVPGAGTEAAFDQQPGAAHRLQQYRIAGSAGIELSKSEAIPLRPFGQDFRKDCREAGFEISLGPMQNAVFEAVWVGKAGECAPAVARRGVGQDHHHRGRPLVCIHADFGSLRHTITRHQVVPGRQREKTIPTGVAKGLGETARQSPKIGICVNWH